MAFMEMQITSKGAMYGATCKKCGEELFTHEFITDDHNERRDALRAGTLRCDCGGTVDPETFYKYPRPMYAGRYSAPGYMDCTDWLFDSNRRSLERELRRLYGDEE